MNCMNLGLMAEMNQDNIKHWIMNIIMHFYMKRKINMHLKEMKISDFFPTQIIFSLAPQTHSNQTIFKRYQTLMS